MNSLNKEKKIKVRGTGTYDPADKTFGFVPFNDAPSTQTDVKKCAGGGKRWVTTGSDPSKMISLKSKESSADQYADFVSQFNALASRGAAAGSACSAPAARKREIQQSN